MHTRFLIILFLLTSILCQSAVNSLETIDEAAIYQNTTNSWNSSQIPQSNESYGNRWEHHHKKWFDGNWKRRDCHKNRENAKFAESSSYTQQVSDQDSTFPQDNFRRHRRWDDEEKRGDWKGKWSEGGWKDHQKGKRIGFMVLMFAMGLTKLLIIGSIIYCIVKACRRRRERRERRENRRPQYETFNNAARSPYYFSQDHDFGVNNMNRQQAPILLPSNPYVIGIPVQIPNTQIPQYTQNPVQTNNQIHPQNQYPQQFYQRREDQYPNLN